MHSNLRDQQLKAIDHIYRLLYINLMVTTQQKSVMDTHTQKKKEPKHNTKDRHQITREDGKRRTTKTTRK